MSFDVEKFSQEETIGTPQRDLKRREEPIAQNSETLFDKDRAILMTLFEWLISGHEEIELSEYAALFCTSRAIQFRHRQFD